MVLGVPIGRHFRVIGYVFKQHFDSCKSQNESFALSNQINKSIIMPLQVSA